MLSDAALRQWFIDRFDCLHCLDSGIIFHRDGTDEPCDYCDAFSKKIEAGVNNDRKLTETANKSVA